MDRDRASERDTVEFEGFWWGLRVVMPLGGGRHHNAQNPATTKILRTLPLETGITTLNPHQNRLGYPRVT